MILKRRAQSVERKAKTQNLKLLTFSLNFTLFALSFTLLCGCGNERLYKDNRLLMGTYVEVISPDKDAPGIVFKEIKRLEDLLSKYNKDSEVARLNKYGRLKVSPETFYLIKRAKEFYSLTNGAFDITVGPLVDLWGFTNKNYFVPKESRIREALRLVGSDKIVLHDSDNVIKFKTSGMSIDLGGIAKGFAVDSAVAKLKSSGIKSCLINAGGQIYALGDRFGKPWRVGIRDSRQREKVSEILELKDRAVSTSGDYEQYFFKNNRRYSHIFNPKSGYPADSGVIAVTVVAPDGLTADALTTAVFVLGKKEVAMLSKKFPGIEIKITEAGTGS